MLEELRRITSTQPYKSSGGMWVKEMAIAPWNDQAKLLLELSEDDEDDTQKQLWEIVCNGLGLEDSRRIPNALVPTCQIKLLDNHPLLWNYENEIFVTINTTTDAISSLIGDLFIEHTNACGNWVDFHRLYRSLDKTLLTLSDNQLAIPAPLKEACFLVLDKYGVRYSIDQIQEGKKGYSLLFFSNAKTWPDEENFGQPFIMAKEFSERKIV
jgi:hypothetical protein